MAFLHALLVIAAFVGAAAIPCALGLLIISFDETIGKFSNATMPPSRNRPVSRNTNNG